MESPFSSSPHSIHSILPLSFQHKQAYSRLDSTQSDDAVVSLVREAASRLHLISCPSSFHFLAALKILKPFAATLAQQSGLAAVLVDNVAAHYYLDRTVKGPPSTTTSTTTTGVSLTLMKVHIAMATGLKNLQHSLRVPVIATKHVFSNVTSSGERIINNEKKERNFLFEKHFVLFYDHSRWL